MKIFAIILSLNIYTIDADFIAKHEIRPSERYATMEQCTKNLDRIPPHFLYHYPRVEKLQPGSDINITRYNKVIAVVTNKQCIELGDGI